MKRTVIYSLILAAVTVPLFFPLGLKQTVSPEVEKSYQVIEQLPAGATVIVSFDFEAASVAETRPLAYAVLRHLFSKNISVISLSMLSEGTGLGYNFLAQIAAEYDRKYGQDYMFLGYRPQFQATILGLGESFSKVFPRDYSGKELSSYMLSQRIDNYQGITMIISVADGDLPQYWVDYAQTRYKKPVLALVTAVMATGYYPYLASGQFSGLVGGLKGAAEYEKRIRREGDGMGGMRSQKVVHYLIIAFIIVGNIAYLRSRRRRS